MSTLRYALVGGVGAGKTTLFNALRGRDEAARKTQALDYDPCGALDTPGEFVSHPRLYRALITSTDDVDVLVYVHPADSNECRLPPGLLDIHAGKRVLAVISKCDLPGVDLPAVESLLRRHGIEGPFVHTTRDDPASIERLRQLLSEGHRIEEELK
ncbi:ethanolamine utilization protein EutP [Pseudomonas sp. GD04087]|uniref:EutP/PduV family microcompartment system protein n=1 Tax=Pseudomonas TaxID=286 RepID=UPI001F31F3D8|nr:MULTISPECIES: EutP/PduV family microcompartment system protein [Pseudomonas]MDH0292088.1 ethanolamine utilization protein EutP [Pseudomonas sp. GD04087]MDH1049194.1 ethanolamine utilization protein EutP [Pseudomonas sp. GD03903]MDH1999682.1 ethanolamine utilization protein EutP [Pseudomonas sp. GD03691]